MGSEDGFELIGYTKKRHPDTAVLVMTGYATPETAVQAVRAGAFDLLTKPLIDDELHLAIDRAVSQREITQENEKLRKQLDRRSGLENILSHDYRMMKIFDVIDSVADARASILITGENGTGKSMIARAIHARSSRRNAAFIEVACGALPDTLLESELFGHVAGAYTGANTNKDGKFQLADGGTIFLGRNRNGDGSDASQAASSAARNAIRTTWRRRNTKRRRACHPGNQRGLIQMRCQWIVPTRPLLSHQCRQHRLAGSASAGR